MLPLSALVALWSSGKGMQALINGLNTIYHVKETRNWLVNRIYSMFYMFLFVLALIASLLLLVMGNRIHVLISGYVPFLGNVIGRILGAKTFLVFVMLFLFSGAVPVSAKQKGIPEKPGSGSFSDSCGMVCVFVSVFSVFYIFPDFSIMYGSLSTLILVMVWLYFCMNLLLYGAEINAYFESQFRQAKLSFWQLIARKRREWKLERKKK